MTLEMRPVLLAVCLRRASAVAAGFACVALVAAGVSVPAPAQAARKKKGKKPVKPKPPPDTPPAAPDPTLEEARRHFESAALFYESGEYVAAAKEFEAAFALMPSKVPLLYNAGLAWEAAGNADKAIQAFTRYLKEMPDAPNRDEVEGRLSKLSPSGTAVRVTIDTRPSKARVWVDLKRGSGKTTPYEVSLDPGEHTVYLEKDGYKRMRTAFDVPAGRDSVDIDVDLEAVVGFVVVKGKAGEPVVVDGERVGTLPLAEPLELPVGPHEVRVGTEVDGKRHAVEVREGITSRIGGGGKPLLYVSIPFFVLAAGGAATSVYFGLTASARYRELRDCTVGCPADLDGAIRVGKRLAMITDVAWIGGSVMLAAGTGLLVAALAGGGGGGGKGSTESDPYADAPAGLRVTSIGLTPVPGGGALTVGGRF